MKLRNALFIMAAAALLTACSFTLAADITPPPDYVSPTPMPTLGVLHPNSSPDPRNGAAIFADNCSPCHGTKGLGDGPQSMQLPVTVPGIGLPEVARSASPADWFKVVTQGNIDRFMPPFASALSDQQRWDVIAYALTLHTSAQEIAQGKSLVATNCADCPSKFVDQVQMAARSEDDLVALIRNGGASSPAFGKDYTDDEVHAAAAYLRTLTFASGPQVAAASTPSAAETLPPTAESGIPAPAAQATPAAGMGVVTGRIEAPATGHANPLVVTLHGFDHSADQTSGPQEVLTLSTTAASDGSYSFENVAMPLNRFFTAEVDYAGVKYHADSAAAVANSSQITVPPLKIYETSTDLGLLTLNQLHIVTDFSTAGTVQVIEVFAFSNSSSSSVVISTDGTSIPFIRFPQGAQNPGYDVGQGSAPFAAADQGLAVVPGDQPYSIIDFFSLPYKEKVDINQPIVIDTPSIVVLLPDGVKLEGKQLANKGLQVIQNNNYQEYLASDLKAGGNLTFSLSGQPRTTPAATLDAHQQLLIGAGILGIALIVGGIFLYLRDRKRATSEPAQTGSESADELLDAILALDDLHRAGKISDGTYHTRRAELKETLRRLG